MINLYEFQKGKVTTQHTALYWEPGLGKTYSGLNRAMQYGTKNIFVVCQKSKINDWVNAIKEFIPSHNVRNVRTEKALQEVLQDSAPWQAIINYDLLWRRRELLSKLNNYTLILDESSLIKNPSAKRTRTVMQNMCPDHVILLSGTPCSGRYEELVTQANLLGWKISKSMFWQRYVNSVSLNLPGHWFPIQKVLGYKNVEELKDKLRTYGADFKLSTDYIDLPEQVFTNIQIDRTSDYKKFEKTLVLERNGEVITGDTPLVKLIRLRQLTNSDNKLQAVKDLLESVPDRLIIFYSFTEELERLIEVSEEMGHPISTINGNGYDLTEYEEKENSVTLCQYQAGAYGHNLQKANKLVFYSPTLSSEQYDQAIKRIHRIGQSQRCFYWKLITTGSVEEKIYKTIEKRQNYNLKLFEEDYL